MVPGVEPEAVHGLGGHPAPDPVGPFEYGDGHPRGDQVMCCAEPCWARSYDDDVCVARVCEHGAAPPRGRVCPRIRVVMPGSVAHNALESDWMTPMSDHSVARRSGGGRACL
ncbi:hypothetical protein GCM10012280_00120 [Wenjunlia tyrosinilytica]|uniref:Uncharacterized protein n=1 Tax=Wenjunlia tyrosinilytica TaxID=1544741 RepID=A0A917ZAM2_9ACTN|nr:hypothetical protein GCM10012280_00120 [Wenjunlia tyrosinilytica]